MKKFLNWKVYVPLFLLLVVIAIVTTWGINHSKQMKEINNSMNKVLRDKFDYIESVRYIETDMGKKTIRVVFSENFNYMTPESRYVLLDSFRDFYIKSLKSKNINNELKKEQITVKGDINYPYSQENKATLENEKLSVVDEDKEYLKKDLKLSSLKKAVAHLNNLEEVTTSVAVQPKSETVENVYSLTDSQKVDVWGYSKKVVKDNLKAPSTAEFPNYNESFIQIVNNQIVVSSYVDAENSFGAKLRSNFIVTLDGNFNLINVSIE